MFVVFLDVEIGVLLVSNTIMVTLKHDMFPAEPFYCGTDSYFVSIISYLMQIT